VCAARQTRRRTDGPTTGEWLRLPLLASGVVLVIGRADPRWRAADRSMNSLVHHASILPSNRQTVKPSLSPRTNTSADHHDRLCPALLRSVLVVQLGVRSEIDGPLSVSAAPLAGPSVTYH